MYLSFNDKEIAMRLSTVVHDLDIINSGLTHHNHSGIRRFCVIRRG